ncbi:MAG: hypothetical protein MK116_10595 [Phycisphaerales bacterium]|nr:hypothetical protein [Phycisphaerales bacterium]
MNTTAHRHRMLLPALVIMMITAAGTTSCDSNQSNVSASDPRLQGTFTLYRLDGDRYPGDPVPEGAVLMHGWPILQSCPIDSTATRQELIQALDDGIANGGGVPVDCFNPRHAIRIEAGDTTTDYMICFQCSNYDIWTNDRKTGGGLMSSSPKSTFNRVLDRCN